LYYIFIIINIYIKISNHFLYMLNNKKKNNICRNILETGTCKYGNNCHYAHSVNEQNLSDIRLSVYKLIKSKNLAKIDPIKDKHICNELTILSHLCDNCIKHNCTGGLNCKNGAYSKEYLICDKDLMFGKCIAHATKSCDKIHLTDYGLIPFNKDDEDSLNDDLFGEDEKDESVLYNFNKTVFE
jgi:hypothetical protein